MFVKLIAEKMASKRLLVMSSLCLYGAPLYNSIGLMDQNLECLKPHMIDSNNQMPIHQRNSPILVGCSSFLFVSAMMIVIRGLGKSRKNIPKNEMCSMASLLMLAMLAWAFEIFNCFLWSIPDQPQPSSTFPSSHIVSVAFSGIFSGAGTLSLSMSSPIAQTMAISSVHDPSLKTTLLIASFLSLFS